MNPTTARKESNFRSMCKSLGYRMKGASPAVCSVRFYDLPDPADPDYPVAMPTTFYVRPQLQVGCGDVVYQPRASVLVDLEHLLTDPTLGRYFDIEVSQGEEQYLSITSKGLPSWQFTLDESPVLDVSLVLTVGGEVWSEVENLVTADVDGASKVYSTLLDSNGVCQITFGDGKYGKVPPAGTEVSAVYRTGGGTIGNQPAGAIDTILGTSNASLYQLPEQLRGASVINLAAAEMGGPKQPLEHAKLNLALVRRINDRCVSNSDYAIAAEKVSGVFAAQAVTGKPQGGAAPVILLVVPNGAGVPSLTAPTKALGTAICNYLEPYRMRRDRILVRGADYASLVIEVDAFVNVAASAVKVKDAVEKAILAMYSPSVLGFNPEFLLQDLYELLRSTNIEGLRHAFVRKFTLKPAVYRHVNATWVGDGGITWFMALPTNRREWAVKLGPALNRYTVMERIPGSISRLSDMVIEDDASRFEVNGLVGWDFHPAPDVSNKAIPIISNTETSFATAGGNLQVASPSDDYVVERVAGYGKVLSCNLAAPAAVGATQITVIGADMVSVGDAIVMTSSSGSVLEHVVTNKNPASPTAKVPCVLTLNRAVAQAVPAGAKVDYVWSNSDSSIRFAVSAGSSASSVGDELYLDSFPTVGDIVTRRECFASLSRADLVVNTIGGVK